MTKLKVGAKKVTKPDIKRASRQVFIDGLVTAMEKKYGRGCIVRASDAKGLEIVKFSTGIVSLDLALLGGWAEGRILHLAGKFSTGKTTAAYSAARQFQAKYPDDGVVILVSAEKEVDTTWAEFNGVDLDSLLLILPNYGERGVDQTILAMERAYAGEIHLLIIIDSLSQMTPLKQYSSKTAEQNHMGKFPIFVSEMYRKITAQMQVDLTTPRPYVTLLVLNRLGSSMDMFNPDVAPGGNAKDNLSSQIVFFKQGTKIKEQLGSKNSLLVKQAVAGTTRFIVKKNKCHGSQDATGEFTYYNREVGDHRAGTYDNVEQTIAYGLVYDIIEKHVVQKVTEFSLPTIDDSLKFKSMKELSEAMKLDDELYASVYTALMREVEDRFWSRKITGELETEDSDKEGEGEEEPWYEEPEAE